VSSSRTMETLSPSGIRSKRSYWQNPSRSVDPRSRQMPNDTSSPPTAGYTIIKDGSTLLRAKMVLRILPLLENTEQAELEHGKIRLEGTSKPKAFAYLKDLLPAEMLSAAWDDIQAVNSDSELEKLVDDYTRKAPSE